MDHVRGAHTVPGEIKKVRLETLFPPWTVTRQVYTQLLTSRHSGISNDVLLFSDIGLSLIHHYRVHKRGLPHVGFRRNYVSQLCALLPLPTVLPIEGGSPDPACSSLPCAAGSPDVVCASPRPSRNAIGRRRPIRVMESPVRIAPRLTVQDPLAAAGAVVLDCRPPLWPAAINVSGVDLSEIHSSTMAIEADAVPPEREQSFGGGDLLSLICPELGVAPLVDPGTDLEDELSTPTVLPVAADHRVAPLSTQADVDIDLGRVFQDVGSLPAMVTPVCDLEEGLVVTPAECPVPATPGVAQPLMVTSPAGPTVISPGCPQPSTGSVCCCSSVPPTIPVVSTPEKSLLFQAAEMDQYQPWSGSSFGGESAGRPLPASSLTPRPAGASPHVGESDADGGRSGVPDLSREGLFDVHQDRPHSGASPRLLQGTQGCPFRMTSYDENTVDQILRQHMGSSSTIHACWSMSALRSRRIYSVVAQNTGSITWEERRKSRPRYSCNSMLG